MLKIEINDRVKLTPRAAEAFRKCRGGRKRSFDWSSRRGTAVRLTLRRDAVFVLWDGRTSPDEWPIAAIEKVSDVPEC